MNNVEYTVTATLDTFNSPAVRRPLTGAEMLRLTREVMNAFKND